VNRLDPVALDRYITGNYGEDQFKEPIDEPDPVAIDIPGALVEAIKRTEWWAMTGNSEEAPLPDQDLYWSIFHAKVRSRGFGQQYRIYAEDWQEADLRAILTRLAQKVLDDPASTPGEKAAARRVIPDAE
jgi:hypothetical protein